MTQVNLQTNTIEHYQKQVHKQATKLRATVDYLRLRITKKIGKKFDVVQAIRESRQER